MILDFQATGLTKNRAIHNLCKLTNSLNLHTRWFEYDGAKFIRYDDQDCEVVFSNRFLLYTATVTLRIRLN